MIYMGVKLRQEYMAVIYTSKRERERLPTNQPTQGDKEMVPYDACLLGH